MVRSIREHIGSSTAWSLASLAKYYQNHQLDNLLFHQCLSVITYFANSHAKVVAPPHTECQCHVILSHAKVWSRGGVHPLSHPSCIWDIMSVLLISMTVLTIEFHDSFDISGVGNTKSPARNSLGTQASCQHVDGKIQMWSKITAY